jgi:hypothetical protein
MLGYTPLEKYKQSHIYNMYSKLANVCCNLHCVESYSTMLGRSQGIIVSLRHRGLHPI